MMNADVPCAVIRCVTTLQVVGEGALSTAEFLGVLAAHAELEIICGRAPLHRPSRVDATCTWCTSLDEIVAPHGATLHFAGSMLAFVDAVISTNGAAISTIPAALRFLVVEASDGVKAGAQGSPLMQLMFPLCERLQSLDGLREVLLARCDGVLCNPSLEASMVHQLLVARQLLHPHTATNLATVFSSVRMLTPAAIAAVAITCLEPATAHGTSPEAVLYWLAALEHLLSASNPLHLPLFEPSNAPADAATKPGLRRDVAPALVQGGCATRHAVLSAAFTAQQTLHMTSSDKFATDSPSELPAFEARLFLHWPPLPPTPRPSPPSLPHKPLAAADHASLDGIRMAVGHAVVALLHGASRCGELPFVLSAAIEGRVVSAMAPSAKIPNKIATASYIGRQDVAVVGTTGAAAAAVAAAAWRQLLRAALADALETTLLEAADTSPPLLPLLAAYLEPAEDVGMAALDGEVPASTIINKAALIGGGGVEMPWASLAAALPELRLRNSGDASLLPVWRFIPSKLQILLDTLSLALDAVGRQHKLIECTIRADMVVSNGDYGGDCSASGQNSLSIARVVSRVGAAFLQPLILAMRKAVRGSGQKAVRRSGQVERFVCADEVMCFAVWLGCLAMNSQLPSVLACLGAEPSHAATTASTSVDNAVTSMSATSAAAAASLLPQSRELALILPALGDTGRVALNKWAHAIATRWVASLPVTPAPLASASAFTVGAVALSVHDGVQIRGASIMSGVGSRQHWQAMPLDSTSGAGATIPLPQRSSDACVLRIGALLSASCYAAAAVAQPIALATVASHARAAFAAVLEPLVAAEAGRVFQPDESQRMGDARPLTELPESAIQLLFDLSFLETVLPAGEESACGSTLDAQYPTLVSLVGQMASVSHRIDPIAHTLVDKSLSRAVGRSVSALATMLLPLGNAATPIATSSGAGSLTKMGHPEAMAEPQALMKLPAACARYRYLPVQTPTLRSKQFHRETCSVSTLTGQGDSSIASAVGAVDDGSGASESAVTALSKGVKEGLDRGLAKVGGVLSSTTLGGQFLGGFGTFRASTMGS